MGDIRNAQKILIEKSESPLARSRLGWEDNIEMEQIGMEGTDWFHLAQVITSFCEHGNESSGPIEGGGLN
jgi:hypothetical protein